MSYPATVYKVMIASPADVSAERSIVREVLSEWNVVNADTRRIVLLPVGWETHAVPEMGAHPQAIINKRVLEGCDLLIGVFWTRIGTVTPSSESGTVEEIEEHLKTDRPVMLYFSSVPVIPDSVDLDQYQRLKDFRSRCQSRGLYESYLDINDFRSKLYRHLQIKLNNDSYFQGAGGPDADGPLSDIPKAAKLSKEAAFLLKECAADRSGQILYLSHLSGYVLQVRDRNLIEDNNERSRATWIAALEELEQHGFVKPLSDKRNVFKITKGGYDAADRLP